MSTALKISYEFGPFRVDPDKQLLLRENQPVAITPKALETLLVLLRHGQEVVSKDALMKELWPDAFVEEANLTQNIFMLRKALGDTPEQRLYIVTLPGRGYRFAAEVRTVTQGGDLVIASHTRSEFILEQEESVSSRVLPAPGAQPRPKVSWKYVAIGASLALLAIAAVFFLRGRAPAPLGEKDSVLIADFTNATGDPVFDDALTQGLTVQLEQSPFLNLVSQDQVQQTLRLMGLPPDTRVISSVARGICERTGSAAMLEGSIANLGTQYVIGLRATNCRTGNLLDVEQAQTARKEEVLNALTQIARRFRTRVGESLATIRQHDTPLAEATTPSLDALNAYSIGWRLLASGGDAAALPFFERAIQIDPYFAMAHASLGRIYGDLGEAALSAQSTARAYELRDHTGDPEKFWISAAYETQVTENLIRAEQTCEVWARTYPRDWNPHAFLAGVIYPVLGKYEQAVEEATTDVEINPHFAIIYFILASRYQELGRLDDAQKSFEIASQRKLDIPDFLMGKYDLAFLKGNQFEMDRLAKSARADPSADEWVTHHEGFVLADSGRLRDAVKTSQRAEDLAWQAGHKEAAALYKTGAALWEAFFGDGAEARRSVTAALALSNDRGVEYGAAFALALAGDWPRSQQLADDLNRRFPEDTSVQFSYLPALRAQIAIDRGQPDQSIDLLQKAVPYEFGTPRTALHANFGALYPIYVRGEAYLAQHRGQEASVEFEKILDHPGIVVSDPIGALAHLQLARAYALAGDKTKAVSSYQTFLTLWKDADPGIPILTQAKAEYSKLH
jgi:DNA-binding winged helix-turn-helix (wHTH) protein/tetratricopeptide (TPR) repeat protein